MEAGHRAVSDVSVLIFTAWIHIYQNLWGELRESVESTASTDAAPVTPMALAAFADWAMFKFSKVTPFQDLLGGNSVPEVL